MANLEGNDIDDLFKRASDKYPLRTDSADWDKLAAALEKDPSLIVPPPTVEGDRRRRRGFFWLFLLLPLGGIGYYVWLTSGHDALRTTASRQVGSSQQAPAPARASSNSPVSTQTGSSSTVVAPENAGTITPAPSGTVPAGSAKQGPVTTADADRQAPATTISHPAANTGTPTANTGTPAANTDIPETNTTSAVSKHKHAAGSVQASLTPVEREMTTKGPEARHQAGSVRQVTASSRKYGSSVPAGTHKTILSEKDEYAADRNTDNQGKISSMNGGNREQDPALSNLNWQRARISSGVALNVTVKAATTTTTAKDSNIVKAVTPKNKSKKESSFYAGLLVAPDLSTVKFQSLKGVGTTYGILLGYNINQKWAIETGAYLDHKKYYTDGEYFKKSDYPSNPNYKLLNVDGSCNMIEIPVNVRYNLSSGVKTKWFATAGFSTYLMTSESYVSEYTYNGGNPWTKPWDTSKPSQYWFSVFNLSVGYEQKLGKIGNLRLEPYLRVPLSGVGSGSLHIMSAGLNIGITRKLW